MMNERVYLQLAQNYKYHFLHQKETGHVSNSILFSTFIKDHQEKLFTKIRRQECEGYFHRNVRILWPLWVIHAKIHMVIYHQKLF